MMTVKYFLYLENQGLMNFSASVLNAFSKIVYIFYILIYISHTSNVIHLIFY